MKTNQIRLNIQNFRAIQEADIVLDGITVVAGENGCGKSTISKFLYYVFKNIYEYNRLLDKRLRIVLNEYAYFLDSVREALYKSNLAGESAIAIKHWDLYKDLLVGDKFLDQLFWDECIDKLHVFCQNTPYDPVQDERFTRILSDVLDTDLENKNISQLLELVRGKVHRIFEVVTVDRQKQDASLLKEELSTIFSSNSLPEKYGISEYNNLIIGDNEEVFIKPFTIRQVVYIDTPVLLGIEIEGTEFDYWNDVNKLLRNKPKEGGFNTDIDKIISRDILRGEACVEEAHMHAGTMDVFTYRREDGTEFNLLECATGIKSFAMLQMLLKNGFLNKYTLLIIDEPESHLHPQWIIEYARLIVLLNKHVGVKFFIASHNPDMVSAIKYISEKENTDNNLNFYMAEREEGSFQYKYMHLGTDIEPIFESFNIALDRISLYGTKNEDEE